MPLAAKGIWAITVVVHEAQRWWTARTAAALNLIARIECVDVDSTETSRFKRQVSPLKKKTGPGGLTNHLVSVLLQEQNVWPPLLFLSTSLLLLLESVPAERAPIFWLFDTCCSMQMPACADVCRPLSELARMILPSHVEYCRFWCSKRRHCVISKCFCCSKEAGLLFNDFITRNISVDVVSLHNTKTTLDCINRETGMIGCLTKSVQAMTVIQQTKFDLRIFRGD